MLGLCVCYSVSNKISVIQNDLHLGIDLNEKFG